MGNIVVYEAISRVVKDNNVIGLMVKPYKKKGQQVFMSMEVLSFGLAERTFEIKDVKLGNNGKPRGCNGFLLSKLPIVDLEEEEVVKTKIMQVMKHIISLFGVFVGNVEFSKSGITLNCIALAHLSDYEGMDVDVANLELSKTLKFYEKTFPKELKKLYDSIEGKVDANGVSTLIVSKQLVKEGLVV